MRHVPAFVLLAAAALLLTPGATSAPFVPGDPTPPVITPGTVGTLGSNGWYVTNVTASWTVTDPESIILETQGCDTRTFTADTAGTTLTCSARSDGGTTILSRTITRDTTDPRVTTITPSRAQPDANGWYNHDLTVTFAGTDDTSGVPPGGCTQATYSGPDRDPATVPGTCTDRAGNESAASSFQFKYDETDPRVTTITPSRAQPDANGWYNHDLTVTFAGTDDTSGVPPGGCTQATYSGPDRDPATVPGTCTDRAGNESAASSFQFKYDDTAPSNLGGSLSRPQPDANGWYNQTVTVTFAGDDVTSPPTTCTRTDYSGPDGLQASVAGTCTDRAGNESISRVVQFNYDDTAPALTPSARAPDANGWYNRSLTVSFPGADATSGIAACTQPQTYSTPDRENASITGSCTNTAGLTTTRTFTFDYDASAPTLTPAARGPDANGWYNRALTVSFPGADAVSGIAVCTQPQTYSTPDQENASITGSCTNAAGLTTTRTFGFQYDATKPQVTDRIPSRPPNDDGWYKDPVSVDFRGSDNLSGVASCSQPSYGGPESATASVTGTCLDKAGNESIPSSFGFKYDSTGPAVIPTATREPDVNGWYNHGLSVNFTGSDGGSGLAACAGPQNYEGPDTGFAVVSGTCTDKAGNVGLGSLALKYDATAPQVAGASADRAPDGNGWYNHPLTVRFFGSDATSDIDRCTVAGYEGPNNLNASVTGSCHDRAGNESGANAFALKYDAIAPSLTKLTVKAGNRSAVVSWEASPDTNLVEIARSAGPGPHAAPVTVYRGTGRSFRDTGLTNGVRYSYTATGFDEAQNAATQAAAATPTAPLLAPKAGATVYAPPRLAWRADEKATYYNVQVWRRGRIFSAWPTRTSLQLKRTWRYNGRRYRLAPGRYRWYVWPGYRKRAQKDFGPLIGSSSFVVARR